MFFLPLFDDNPPGRPPIINWLLILACVLVFLYQASLPLRQQYGFIFHYGAIPLLISNGEASASLITSMFLHGGWMHLGGNMLYLWIFGDNIEDKMGSFRFILFYLLCGVVATLTHIAIGPSSEVPLVGASGAIAGVLAAYLLLFPRAKVRVLIVILIFLRWIYMPAFVVLGGWLLLQFIAAPASLAADSGTAYFAHIGGFVAGLVLTPFFKKRDVPIFPPAPEPAQADQAIEPVPTRQVRNEFVERYRYRRRGTSIPNVRRQKPDDPPQRRGPWG